MVVAVVAFVVAAVVAVAVAVAVAVVCVEAFREENPTRTQCVCTVPQVSRLSFASFG